jgi:hypothetical protein
MNFTPPDPSLPLIDQIRSVHEDFKAGRIKSNNPEFISWYLGISKTHAHEMDDVIRTLKPPKPIYSKMVLLEAKSFLTPIGQQRVVLLSDVEKILYP